MQFTLSMCVCAEVRQVSIVSKIFLGGRKYCVRALEIMSHGGLPVPFGHWCLNCDNLLPFLSVGGGGWRWGCFALKHGWQLSVPEPPGGCSPQSASPAYWHNPSADPSFAWSQLPFLKKNQTHDMWFLVNNDTASPLTFSPHEITCCQREEASGSWCDLHFIRITTISPLETFISITLPFLLGVTFFCYIFFVTVWNTEE